MDNYQAGELINFLLRNDAFCTQRVLQKISLGHVMKVQWNSMNTRQWAVSTHFNLYHFICLSSNHFVRTLTKLYTMKYALYISILLTKLYRSTEHSYSWLKLVSWERMRMLANKEHQSTLYIYILYSGTIGKQQEEVIYTDPLLLQFLSCYIIKER